MRKAIKKVLLAIVVLGCFSIHNNGAINRKGVDNIQANPGIDTNIADYYGVWVPYKNVPCDIVEYPNIPLEMKLKVCLYSHKIIFFKDTVYSPSYRIINEKVGFLCPISYSKLNITTDYVNVLIASGVTKDSISYPGPALSFIIMGKNKLIGEDGQGVMFFFYRQKQPSNTPAEQ